MTSLKEYIIRQRSTRRLSRSARRLVREDVGEVRVVLAEDIIRSREDIKYNRIISQSDLIKELHLFGN